MERKRLQEIFRVGCHILGLHSQQGTIGWVRQIHKRHLENEIMLRVWAQCGAQQLQQLSLLQFTEELKKKVNERQRHTQTTSFFFYWHTIFAEHTIYTHDKWQQMVHQIT